jgi:hypothetical protein
VNLTNAKVLLTYHSNGIYIKFFNNNSNTNNNNNNNNNKNNNNKIQLSLNQPHLRKGISSVDQLAGSLIVFFCEGFDVGLVQRQNVSFPVLFCRRLALGSIAADVLGSDVTPVI